MICNTIGLTTDSFETLYVHGGADVPEVYGSINYAQPIFYSLKTLTGATSYSFMGYPEPLKSCEISGNMVQSGTPTPTSPIYPQECGELEENVAIISSRSDTVTDFYYVDVRLSDVLPAGTYTVSFTMDSKTWNATASSLGWGNKTKYQGNVVQYQIPDAPANINKTITLNSNACIWARFLRSATPATFSYSVSKIAIVSGNKPYGLYKIPLSLNGTTQNLYLPEPLRKIGDYVDEVNSDGTVTRRIKKLVLTGEEDWEYRSGTPENVFFIEFYSTNFVRNKALCTHYINQDSGSFEDIADKHCLVMLSSDNIRSFILIRDSSYSYRSNLKSYLADQYAAGTPVTIWYALATPTTEQVTVPTLTPATGSNTLTIGTTLQPSSLSITGHVKPSS